MRVIIRGIACTLSFIVWDARRSGCAGNPAVTKDLGGGAITAHEVHRRYQAWVSHQRQVRLPKDAVNNRLITAI